MLPLIPLLIASHPLLLTLLSGSNVAEVALGVRVRAGDLPWVVAVLAGVPIWVLTDWLFWAAGRRWGDRALYALVRRRDPEHARERVERAERMAHRLGPAGVVLAKFLPVPTQLMYAAAGVGEMRLKVFVALNLLGTTLTAALVVTLGYLLGRRAVGLLEQVREYAVLLTVVAAVAVVVVLVVQRQRRRRRRTP